MRIACLHTAASHQNTFSALFSARAPRVSLIHVVRDDLLIQAQVVGIEAIAEPVMEALGALSSADAILCTCSTLGPLVDTIQSDKYVRIDRPLMEAAAEHGPRPLLALCLESTRGASVAAFADARGADADPQVLMCEDAWPAFVRGDTNTFAERIAHRVRDALDQQDCVILGQASMAFAAERLSDIGKPVLSAPDLAVARTLMVAGA